VNYDNMNSKWYLKKMDGLSILSWHPFSLTFSLIRKYVSTQVTKLSSKYTSLQLLE
jgi:hypothetical protein